MPGSLPQPLALRSHGHQFRSYNPDLGDGRLTLKGGMREVLATKMLEALGVYTSKSFSLIETGEDLVRDDWSLFAARLAAIEAMADASIPEA